MENEYAKVGLPDDPANQPVQPQQFAAVQRGWSRNFWWMLPAALLVLVSPCLCCGGIFWWVIKSAKSSEPYQMSLERVPHRPRRNRTTGRTHRRGRLDADRDFSYRTDNGVTSGKASFDFAVSGPKGTARVHAKAVCRDGKWRFRVLEVTPASSGRTISLSADEKPGKAEKEDGVE